METKSPYRNMRFLLEIYRYVQEYQKQNGISPSRVEIGARFPKPGRERAYHSTVRYWLERMAQAGMIEPQPMRSARAIRLLPLSKKFIDHIEGTHTIVLSREQVQDLKKGKTLELHDGDDTTFVMLEQSYG